MCGSVSCPLPQLQVTALSQQGSCLRSVYTEDGGRGGCTWAKGQTSLKEQYEGRPEGVEVSEAQTGEKCSQGQKEQDGHGLRGGETVSGVAASPLSSLLTELPFVACVTTLK